MLKIMVTGSREWVDRQIIAQSLLDVMNENPQVGEDQFTLVHGAAAGADRLTAAIAHALGWEVEAHPAIWRDATGRTDRAAGFKRNLRMLETGPDLVLAFWANKSPGTAHSIREARYQNIPLRVFEVNTTSTKPDYNKPTFDNKAIMVFYHKVGGGQAQKRLKLYSPHELIEHPFKDEKVGEQVKKFVREAASATKTKTEYTDQVLRTATAVFCYIP